jgi:hypothetical protein
MLLFLFFQKTGTKDLFLSDSEILKKKQTGTDNSLNFESFRNQNWQFTYYQNQIPIQHSLVQTSVVDRFLEF